MDISYTAIANSGLITGGRATQAGIDCIGYNKVVIKLEPIKAGFLRVAYLLYFLLHGPEGKFIQIQIYVCTLGCTENL